MGCVQRREGVPDENPCRVRGEAIWRGQRRWALRQGLHTQQRSGQPCTTDRGLTHPETRVTVTQCITATDWGAGSGKGTGKGQADTLACPGCRILLLWEASRLTLTPASFPLQNLPTWIHCPLVREMGRRAHKIQRNSDLLSICSTLYSGLGLFIYWSHGRESLP